MPTQYAFVVNSDACSGCKTCQVACNDKNNLRAGLHWRKVYEVTAGEWERKDGAWVSSVVAYNLSVACHHCERPVCANLCQGEAIWKRPDGIVLIDDARCTKCHKCEQDCPYGAVRFDRASNVVFKCDFCADYLDAGAAPACVAACPNRALDYGDFAELRAKHRDGTAMVFPLADPSIARPSLIVLPHRSAATAARRNPEIANWEEL